MRSSAWAHMQLCGGGGVARPRRRQALLREHGQRLTQRVHRVDHGRVVVPARLAIDAPVRAEQVRVKIVGGDGRFARRQLLASARRHAVRRSARRRAQAFLAAAVRLRVVSVAG